MATIREYGKGTIINKNSEMNVDSKINKENADFRKMIKEHRLKVFYRILLGIILAAAIGAVVFVNIKNRVYTDYQILSTVDRDEAADTWVKPYNGNVLTYSKDGANCTDAKGKVLWNQTYQMQSPMVSICGDVVALGDYNGRTLYVMNSEGSMGEIETGMPIRTFQVSKDGVVAAVLDDSDVTWIYLLDPNGSTIASFKTTMNKSGYPIAVTISDNSEIVGVSYLYVDSGVIKSNVAFYNFGEVGQNEIDNYVSGYSYTEAVVPEMGFLNDSTIFAVADNRLMFYKGKQIPTSDSEVLLQEEVQSVFHGDNYVGLVYLNVAGKTQYKMDIYNETGKLIHTQEFDIDYTDIMFHKNYVILYNDSECCIYTIDGIQKYKGEFKEQITAMIPMEQSNQFMIVTANKMEKIELK